MAVEWDAFVYEDDAVLKAIYDANTILAADTDDTPAALTIDEQTLVGRITAGNIAALTPTQVRTLISVEDGADVTDATNVDAAGAVMEADVDAKGDIFVATGNDALTRLAVGTNSQVLTANSAQSEGIEWADAGAPGAHDIGGASHNADTLADFNTKISDATLDDNGDPRTPSTHAASHKDSGSDEILLHEFGQPTGNVQFNGQQSLNIVMHKVADATARTGLTPIVGKVCYQEDVGKLYVCTSAV